jgi:hypothetical protein
MFKIKIYFLYFYCLLPKIIYFPFIEKVVCALNGLSQAYQLLILILSHITYRANPYVKDHIQHINQHTPNARCQVPNDCAGVEELNVAMIYMMVFPISCPFHHFHAWMCRGECAAKFPGHCDFNTALPNLLGATNSPGHCEFHGRYPISWALPTLLGTVNSTGATQSPEQRNDRRYLISGRRYLISGRDGFLHRRHEGLVLPNDATNKRLDSRS